MGFFGDGLGELLFKMLFITEGFRNSFQCNIFDISLNSTGAARKSYINAICWTAYFMACMWLCESSVDEYYAGMLTPAMTKYQDTMPWMLRPLFIFLSCEQQCPYWKSSNRFQKRSWSLRCELHMIFPRLWYWDPNSACVHSCPMCAIEYSL